MASRIQWTDAMYETFLIAYVSFRKNNWWDNRKLLETNYDQLATHLVSNGSLSLANSCRLDSITSRRNGTCSAICVGYHQKQRPGLGRVRTPTALLLMMNIGKTWCRYGLLILYLLIYFLTMHIECLVLQ